MAGGVGGWCLVLPVKRLAVAKTRLGPPYEGRRQQLALAFALDTAEAVLATRGVRGLVAVTDEPEAARALRELGAEVVPDEPDAGLNPALRHGATRAALRFPGCGTGALSADLPSLRPDELALALDRARDAAAFVRDLSGSGTTLVLAAAGHELQPEFGTDSARQHLLAGHTEVPADDLPTLRLDVDTAADLTAALRLGVGTRTAAALR